MVSPIAVSVKTAAALVDVSETTLREAINRRQLPAFRVGRMIRVLVSDLEEWFRSLPAVGAEDES